MVSTTGMRGLKYRMADESLLSSFISQSVFAANVREGCSDETPMRQTMRERERERERERVRGKDSECASF